jgi:hypothetical protein
MQPARRLLVVSAAAVLILASPAESQIGFGGHVARATDAFGGSTGLGARVRLGVPLFPLSAAANVEYFFTDCDVDCSLWGATFDVNYALPIPLLTPWAGVGWSIRNVEVAGQDGTERGLNIGVGAQLNLTTLRPFVDVRYEMADAPEKQYIIRLGVMFR